MKIFRDLKFFSKDLYPLLWCTLLNGNNNNNITLHGNNNNKITENTSLFVYGNYVIKGA